MPRKGYHPTEQARHNMSVAHKGLPGYWKGKHRYDRPMLGRHHSKETRGKMSAIAKGRIKSSEHKAKLSTALKGRHCSPATEFTSETMQNLWQDPKFIKRMTAARHEKPNKLEERLIRVFGQSLPQFKYNGDFRLGITLAGLIPDFVNTNGRKEIIELFGDYWHSPEVVGDDWRRTELGKVMLYNSLGYKCFILWGSELQNLSDNEIVNKVKTFFRRKGGKFF